MTVKHCSKCNSKIGRRGCRNGSCSVGKINLVQRPISGLKPEDR